MVKSACGSGQCCPNETPNTPESEGFLSQIRRKGDVAFWPHLQSGLENPTGPWSAAARLLYVAPLRPLLLQPLGHFYVNQRLVCSLPEWACSSGQATFWSKGRWGWLKILGIPHLVIGLTVVAFGTSAPEMFISIQAALAGQSGIAVGNVVGSNIANVLLVIGLPALLAPILANQAGIRRNMAAMIALSVLFLWLLSNGVIGRLEGALLFCGPVRLHRLAGLTRGVSAGQTAEHDFHEELGEAPHTGWKVAA